jgi:HD-like signal output (HDOD) protein
MEQTTTHPDVEQLRHFLPMRALTRDQLKVIARSLLVEAADTGEQLITIGSTDDHCFFLVEGRIRLVAEDGKVSELEAADKSARSPISQLRPHHYAVTAVTPVRFLRIDMNMLSNITELNQQRSGEELLPGFVVNTEEVAVEDANKTNLAQRFIEDYKDGRVILPSLPQFARRFSRALSEGVADTDQLAALIASVPDMADRLVKAANNPLYSHLEPVGTCQGALDRLGRELIMNLIIIYTVRPLFIPHSGLLKERMAELWAHSIRMAAIAYHLAKHDRRFNPEQAMLLGFLHDIGIIAILDYVRTLPFEAKRPYVIEREIDRLRGQVSRLLLRKWGFSQAFAQAAQEAESWQRVSGPRPDYGDLLVATHLHCFAGTDKLLHVPMSSRIPALKRLNLGKFEQKLGLEALYLEREKIGIMEATLNL